MKKKELKKIAERLAQLEIIISESTDNIERLNAKNEVLDISSRIVDIEDLMAIDELVQEILEQKS